MNHFCRILLDIADPSGGYNGPAPIPPSGGSLFSVIAIIGVVAVVVVVAVILIVRGVRKNKQANNSGQAGVVPPSNDAHGLQNPGGATGEKESGEQDSDTV